MNEIVPATVSAIDPVMQQAVDAILRMEQLAWILIAMVLAAIMAYFTLRWFYGLWS